MGKGGRKRKKKEEEESSIVDDSSTESDSSSIDENLDYVPYNAPNYIRKYPDSSIGNVEYIVFLSHVEANQPITEGTRMGISRAIRRDCISGVQHLRTINKFKVGIVFDNANNANMFLQGSKLTAEHKLKTSIPASATETTGVLTRVPIQLSNKKIYSLLASTRNIIQVRRFMRRIRTGGAVKLEPTQTVAVTFSATQLPDHVYLDHWRHEVNTYVPPVKQCLKCLRYGHIAKYCKNTEKCSICTENHNFKMCTIDSANAKCYNCGGNHIAISSVCPVKKQKITELKKKAMSYKYSDILNEKSFPSLSSPDTFQKILNSDKFMNMLVQSVIQIITLHKNKENVSSSSIKKIINETFNKNSNTI